MLNLLDSTEVRENFKFKKNAEGTIICTYAYAANDSDYVAFFPNNNATFRGNKVVHNLTHQEAFNMLKNAYNFS
jgi:hypothetical protein